MTKRHLLSEKQLFVVKLLIQNAINSKFSQYIREIILYGSCARGEQNNDSDVDILIVLSDKNKIKSDYLRKFRGEATGTDVGYPEGDVHYTFNLNWRSAQDIYFKNIQRDGIVLWTREHI